MCGEEQEESVLTDQPPSARCEHLDGGEGFLNASQISHYDVVTVLLMDEWTQ